MKTVLNVFLIKQHIFKMKHIESQQSSQKIVFSLVVKKEKQL